MEIKPKPEGRISDEQLRNTTFRYSDPEHTILALDRSVPDPTAKIVVIGYYDETPAGGRRANPDYPFVWCCHCGKPTHWKGYVIRDENERVHIIGAQNCGVQHYGVHFDQAARTFDANVSRKRVLERWDLISAKASAARGLVDALLQSRELAEVDNRRIALKRGSPECYRELVRHIVEGSELRRHRRARDLDREATRERQFQQAVAAFQHLPADIRRQRRVDGLAPEPDSQPIFREWTEHFGMIQGGHFLLEDGDIRSKLIATKMALKEIEQIQGDAKWVPTAAMSRAMSSFHRSLTDVVGTRHLLRSSPRFFERENVDRLVAWSNDAEKFSLSRGNPGIIVRGVGPEATILPLLSIEIPFLEELSELLAEVEDDA